MNKKLLFAFVKDRVGYISIFILNTFLLIIFFSISTNHIVEIIYPLIISILLLSIYIIIQWFKYYLFYKNLTNTIENIDFRLNTYTQSQHIISEVISKTHKHYIDIINILQKRHKAQKNLISQWIHNLKTPVSVIDLILQKYTNSIEPYEMLHDISEENQKIYKNLDQLLTLNRLDEFSKDYLPERIDIVSEVKDIINKKKNEFIYNGIYPILKSEFNSIDVLSDSKWNKIMLDQILSNAIKYTTIKNTPTHKHIYIEINSYEDKVVLTIKDEGCGIPDYDINRIFEPFFTGENGRKTRNATGIGLYICSLISKNLGHALKIESVQGEGTTVIIYYLSPNLSKS